jgi:drug/metabolite transporter (DMT)-like permease
MISPTLSVLFSEGILSLYPILIKTVPTNLITQWFARFLTFPLLAFLFEPSRPEFHSTTFFAGILNLIHIGSSYLSFHWLPAGIALSLFYLYPLFNVLAGVLFFGESISPVAIPLLLIAFLGVYLITKDSPRSDESDPSNKTYGWGILMGLLAAITETLIFVFVKWNKMSQTASPFYAVKQLYPVGLLFLLTYLAINPSKLDTNPTHLATLFGFNSLVGFVGYCLRFYVIPKVPTLVFSLLSFVGVLFGYLWGHLFTTDRPRLTSWIGSGLIAFSAFFVRWIGIKDS